MPRVGTGGDDPAPAVRELRQSLEVTEAELQKALEKKAATETALGKEMDEMGDAMMNALASEKKVNKRAEEAEAELEKLRTENEQLRRQADEDAEGHDEIMDKLMKALAAQHAAVLKQKDAEKALARVKRDSMASDVAEDMAGALTSMTSVIEVPDFLAGW